MHDQTRIRNPLPPIDVRSSALEPGVLRVRLGVLIARYLREGSAEIAQSVVADLEALCQDPELRDADLFCAYRRLTRHWRWLSAQHGQAPETTTGLDRPIG